MKFLRQDYFRHKRLGRKWRKPKGLQSKLRKGKGGSGILVKIGHGSDNKGKIKNMQPVIVSNASELEMLDKEKHLVVISSGSGAKKTLAISEKAGQLGLKLFNSRKVRRAERIAKAIETKKKEKSADKKKASETETDNKKEKSEDKEKKAPEKEAKEVK